MDLVTLFLLFSKLTHDSIKNTHFLVKIFLYCIFYGFYIFKPILEEIWNTVVLCNMLLSYQASLGSVFHSLLWKNQDYHSAIIITRNKFDKKKSCIGLLTYDTGNDDQYWEQFTRERLSCKSQGLSSSKDCHPQAVSVPQQLCSHLPFRPESCQQANSWSQLSKPWRRILKSCCRRHSPSLHGCLPNDTLSPSLASNSAVTLPFPTVSLTVNV